MSHRNELVVLSFIPAGTGVHMTKASTTINTWVASLSREAKAALELDEQYGELQK